MQNHQNLGLLKQIQIKTRGFISHYSSPEQRRQTNIPNQKKSLTTNLTKQQLQEQIKNHRKTFSIRITPAKIVKIQNDTQSTQTSQSPIKREARIFRREEFNPLMRVSSQPILKQEINLNITVSAKSKSGQVSHRQQKINQDAFYVQMQLGKKKDRSLFIVMDGHGLNGHYISQMVKNVLPQNIERELNLIIDANEISIKNVLSNAFLQTSRDLYSSGIDATFSGTTVLCVLLIGNKLWCANLGDSRCILAIESQQYQCKLLSHDHKPDVPSEQARIISNGGRVSPIRDCDGDPIGPMRVWGKYTSYPGLAMSRSMGDQMAQELGVINKPEIVYHECGIEDSFIVMGSDGVWEWLSNNQVIEIVRENLDNIDIASENIIKTSVQNWLNEGEGEVDDITVIVIKLK